MEVARPSRRLLLTLIALPVCIGLYFGGAAVYRAQQHAYWREWHERGIDRINEALSSGTTSLEHLDPPNYLSSVIGSYSTTAIVASNYKRAQLQRETISLATLMNIESLLGALEQRDSFQLIGWQAQLQRLQHERNERDSQIEQLRSDLDSFPEMADQQWKEVWPNHDLNFKLNLEHISEAIDVERIEALRNRLDLLAEADIATIEQLAEVDLTNTPLQEVSVNPGSYAEQRVEVARARLLLVKRLLGVLDEIEGGTSAP